ncbi:MAG: dissimilatory sulfite reductase D family protein [Deltaproteobacteria bacterium]|nr:dissimilatory sulfite reductase D family protein [Deltaproteobacteria bacterium]
MEELKKKLLDFMTKKSKFKSKMYFKDLCKADENAKMREIKKAATALVQEEKIEYWSSGSTTLYGLKGSSSKETDTFHEE